MRTSPRPTNRPAPRPSPDSYRPPALRASLAGLALALVFGLLAAPDSPAQDEAEPPQDPVPVQAPTGAAEPDSETSLLDVYRQGGWMMHVLLVCSAGTIAVVAYCFVQVSEKKMAPAGLYDTLVRNMRERDVTNGYHLCQENDNSFTRVVAAALLKFNPDRDQGNKASMEQAAGDSLDQEETRQMLWINYLNVFAVIAPMVGLLGTVTGMIKSFGKLAGGQTEPGELAAGIGEAMATTAGGLIVGIPAMFFFFFFRNRLMGIVAKVQREGTFLIDVLSGEVQLSDEHAPRD